MTLVPANTFVVKSAPLGSFVWTAAIVIFPVSYILGDVVTEIYGCSGARRVVSMGFAADVLMVAGCALTAGLPSLDPEFGGQYGNVLAHVPRMVIASLAGIVCGQFANAFVRSRLRVRMCGRWLWSRTISFTLGERRWTL